MPDVLLGWDEHLDAAWQELVNLAPMAPRVG